MITFDFDEIHVAGKQRDSYPYCEDPCVEIEIGDRKRTLEPAQARKLAKALILAAEHAEEEL